MSKLPNEILELDDRRGSKKDSNETHIPYSYEDVKSWRSIIVHGVNGSWHIEEEKDFNTNRVSAEMKAYICKRLVFT